MSIAVDARLGFWLDYNRSILNRCQVLATDFWSSFMLGVVVASLTITNPYVFKIVNNFLIWLFRRIGWLVEAWRTANTSEPPSEQTSLLRPPSGNGQVSSPGEREHPNSPDAASEPPAVDQNVQADKTRIPDATVSSPGEEEHLNSPDAEAGSSAGDQNSQVNETHTPDAATSSPGEDEHLHSPYPECGPSAGDQNVQGNDTRNPDAAVSSLGEDEHLNSPDVESGPSTGDQDVQGNENPTPNAAISNEQNSQVPGLQNGSTVNPAPGDIRQSQYGTETINILGSSRDSREVASNFIRNILNPLKKQTRSPDILVVVVLTIFFGLFVGYVVASTFSAKIASDRAGLASSQDCGIWQFDDRAGDEAADLDDLYNYQKEARASQYARTCYNAPNPDDPFSCRIFYNQSIKFDTKTDQLCPFASSELCSGGLYSAVLFDTGLVDASVIGINAPKTHKFRRTTSCSPLNMSKPYIVSSEGTNNIDYHYYYGRKDDIEYTFNTSGRPFDWLVPVYSVNTYFSSLYPENDYWRPIAELRQPIDSTLTIIFTSSTHIYHTKRSFDPIFYADEPRYFEGFREPLYYNSDPRARVLACVDKSEVCSPDGNTCWSMTAPHAPDKKSSPYAYWLMKWSLENSNTYDSIKWRLGTALLAQESVSQFVSLPLPSNQWEIEASQLFATSLARIQYDALGIATGEDRQRPGYVEVTPDEAKGHLCDIYKFKSPEYTNVNLVAFIGLNLLAIAIIILSLNASTVGLLPKSEKDEKASTRTLVIGFLVNKTVDLAFLVYRKSKECCKNRKDQA